MFIRAHFHALVILLSTEGCAAMQHAISWFDLPATDIERATKFYNEIFQIVMVPQQGMDGMTAFFPFDAPLGVGGAISTGGWYTPSANAGPLIYLNAGADLSPVLGRVEGAGGQVIVPKTAIGENGAIAVFIDSEGNRVGLHSLG
jgi:predicted enzyme related to lactoylglutathione lyase